jgi:hypothetical protein
MSHALSALVLLAAHPLVALRVDECPQVRASDVSRIVELELGQPLASWDAAESGPLTRATVHCSEELAELSVIDPFTGKSLTRQIALPAIAIASRTRLLGLAVSELVAASWVELEANPEPQVPPSGPPPPQELREEAKAASARRSPPPRTRLEVAAEARAGSSGLGLGGAVGVSHDAAPWLGWTVRLTAHHGSAASSLGRIDVDDLTALLAAWLALGVRDLSLHGGLGARAGPVWLTGVPATGSGSVAGAVVGAWAGPALVLGARYSPSSVVSIDLGAETGWVVSPVSGRVAGVRAVSVEGPWAALSLGVTIGLHR